MWSLTNSIKRGDVTGATIDSVGIVLDAVALLLPVVPGGAGVAIKAFRGAEAARQAAGALQKAKRYADVAKNTVRTVDIGLQAASTAVAIDRGDTLGAVLGSAGLGIRGLQGFGAARRLIGRAPSPPRAATELPLLPVVNPRFDVSDELLEARGLTRACFTPGHEILIASLLDDDGTADAQRAGLESLLSDLDGASIDSELLYLLSAGLAASSAVFAFTGYQCRKAKKKLDRESSVDEFFADFGERRLGLT